MMHSVKVGQRWTSHAERLACSPAMHVLLCRCSGEEGC
jgi:hypothetical protein